MYSFFITNWYIVVDSSSGHLQIYGFNMRNDILMVLNDNVF